MIYYFSSMVILGIDPGSVTTGYAFLESKDSALEVLEYGTLHCSASRDFEDRLLDIILKLETLLDKYHPDALSMEGVFFAKNAHSALVLGHIRGAILVACKKRHMTFNEYIPRYVKQAVTGDGGAAKEQVANMIFARLGIVASDLPMDASDALAIAWTHANPPPLMAALKTKKAPSRKKKASVQQWKDLIEKMGGSIP